MGTRQRAGGLRSAFAVAAAVAAVGLVFAAVAQAAPVPPDPNSVGSTTLSSIHMNGGVVATTHISVAPGADVQIAANWSDGNSGCPYCVDFVATAFAGQGTYSGGLYGTFSGGGCIESNGQYGRTSSGSGTVDLGNAPTAPGTYPVVAQFEEVYACGAGWSTAASTGYQVIAEVTVNPPTPTHLKAWPQLILFGPGVGIGEHLVRATLTDNSGHGVSGQTIVFTTHSLVRGQLPILVCSAVTNSQGVATCPVSEANEFYVLDTGYTASFGGTPAYISSTGSTQAVVPYG